MHIVNAVTQIKTATASFISLGCHRNAAAKGRSASGCSPFLSEAILGKHQQVTALCCLAPGEEQEPHGLGHCLHGGPVHCWLYWLAAFITQGAVRPKVCHEKQPWFKKADGKTLLNQGLIAPGSVGFAALSAGHRTDARPSLLPKHSAPLVRPC